MKRSYSGMHASGLMRRRMAANGQRRGVAAVEFALVAPLFLLLIFGTLEYGRMVMVQQVITNAAREGCRLGVLDGSTTAEVQSTINTYLSSAGINGATISVDPSPPSSATYGAPVKVQVTVPFKEVSWLPTPLYLGSTTLKATVIMRRETLQ